MDIFHIVTMSAERRPIFMWEPNPGKLMEVLLDSRRHGKFLLHEFVVLPDQLQALITPQAGVSAEEVVRWIRDEFSRQMAKGEKNTLWQPHFTVHKIKDPQDYEARRQAIHLSPVRAGLVTRSSQYRFCSASPVLAPELAQPE